MEKLKDHFGIKIATDVRDYTIKDRNYLVELIREHKVILWTKQVLSAHELVLFSEIFGETWHNHDGGILSKNGELLATHHETNKITRVSNMNNGVLGSGVVGWHSDISHKPWTTAGGTLPCRALYCVKTPSDQKICTSWFDQQWLYDNISEHLRIKIEKLVVRFKSVYPVGWEDNTVPFILRDPVSGRKSISLSKIFFENFVGMSKDESQNINDELFATAVLEENVIRHEWSEGDLIICNNYTTAHKRDGIQSKQERTLWRTTFQIPELIPLEIKTM